MMGWTKEIWRKSVASSLFQIGNIEFQKNLWTGKIKGYQGDFDECICEYEGCGIPEYLEDFVKDSFLHKDESFELRDLCKMLDEVDELHDYDLNEYNKLWSSKEWKDIANKAKSIFLKYYKSDYLVDNINREFMRKWLLD